MGTGDGQKNQLEAVVKFWTRHVGGLDSSQSSESGDRRLASGNICQNLSMEVGIGERVKVDCKGGAPSN